MRLRVRLVIRQVENPGIPAYANAGRPTAKDDAGGGPFVVFAGRGNRETESPVVPRRQGFRVSSAGPTRFELATSGLTGQRSNQAELRPLFTVASCYSHTLRVRQQPRLATEPAKITVDDQWLSMEKRTATPRERAAPLGSSPPPPSRPSLPSLATPIISDRLSRPVVTFTSVRLPSRPSEPAVRASRPSQPPEPAARATGPIGLWPSRKTYHHLTRSMPR